MIDPGVRATFRPASGDVKAPDRQRAWTPDSRTVAAVDARPPLRFAPLGPGMDLMVGPEPEPAPHELLEFARASGIGTDALERLFGAQVSAISRPAGTAVPPAPQSLAMPMPAAQPQPLGTPLPVTAALWLSAQGAGAVRAEPDALRARADRADGGLPGASAAPLPAFASTERVDVSTVPTAAPTQLAAPAPVSPAVSPLAGAPMSPASYAEMTQRVAQAVASRMVAGLREGNGSLRLQLEPRSLGRVEVEMTLQDGRLEATIVANQALARDLLSDGIARLRETLGQMGMNVAGISVTDGSGGRGDGKPTRQRTGESAYARQSTGAAAIEGVSEGVRPGRGPAGLDVWA